MSTHRVECSFKWCVCPDDKRAGQKATSCEESVMSQEGDNILMCVSSSLLCVADQGSASQGSDKLLAALPLTQLCDGPFRDPETFANASQGSDELLAALPLTQLCAGFAHVPGTTANAPANGKISWEAYEPVSQGRILDTDDDSPPYAVQSVAARKERNASLKSCTLGQTTVRKFNPFSGCSDHDVADGSLVYVGDSDEDDWFPPNQEIVTIPQTPPRVQISPETGELVEKDGYSTVSSDELDLQLPPTEVLVYDHDADRGDELSSGTNALYSPLSSDTSNEDDDPETTNDSLVRMQVTAGCDSPPPSSSVSQIVSDGVASGRDAIESYGHIHRNREMVSTGQSELMDCSPVAEDSRAADRAYREDWDAKPKKGTFFQFWGGGRTTSPGAVDSADSDDEMNTRNADATVIPPSPDLSGANCEEDEEGRSANTTVPRYIPGIEPGPILRLGIRVVLTGDAKIDAMAIALANTCTQCGKIYKTRCSLRVHQKAKHEGVRFECTECSKSYARRSTLLAHLRTHSTRFKCNACEATFIHQTNLMEHFRVKHENRIDLECDKCGKTFYRTAELRKHQEVVHGEEIDDSMA